MSFPFSASLSSSFVRRTAAIALPVLFAVGCKSSTVGADQPKATAQAETTRAPFATPPVLAGAPDVATLVAAVKPSVVNIVIDAVRPASAQGGNADPFEFFFGGRGSPRGEESFRTRAQGSGFIIDKDGHIITNAHVVEGVSQVRVKLADERELKATVKGRDPKLDLAVLKIDVPGSYPAAALGASDPVRVGEYVLAMGNPMGLGHTVTMGIVSAKSRTIGAGPYDDFIQTDASINPGNSGGPLFNLKGEVIAINTAINPRAQNIGFAIPIDAVKNVLPQLLQKGTVSRGRLGLGFQPTMDATLAKAIGLDRPRGALVTKVEPGGPADRAGIRTGDVILNVGSDEVHQPNELARIVAKNAPGSRVDVKVQRDGKEQKLNVVLDELKDEGETSDTRPAPSTGTGTTSSLGVSIEDARGGGAIVRNVTPGGRADGSLAPGDVIVEVNRAKVNNAAELNQKLQADKGTGPTLLKVQRGDVTRFVAIER